MPVRTTHFDQGDTWTPQWTFTVGGTNTDPTNITVKIKKPDGTVTTLGPVSGGTGGSGIVRVSAGLFKTDVDLDDAGYWFARAEGTGAAKASEDHQAIVDPSEFYENAQLGTRALVSLAETKDWLQHVIAGDTVDDLELSRVIVDMSQRFTDESGGREFKVVGTNPHVRLFDVDEIACRYGIVNVGDLTSFTLVRVIADDWVTVLSTIAAGDIISDPVNREPWEPVRRLVLNRSVAALRPGQRVEVTGVFGFPAVPGNVRQAVLEAVAAAVDREVESYRTDLGPVTSGPGTTVVMSAGRPHFLTMPPSALAVARSYAAPLVA